METFTTEQMVAIRELAAAKVSANGTTPLSLDAIIKLLETAGELVRYWDERSKTGQFNLSARGTLSCTKAAAIYWARAEVANADKASKERDQQEAAAESLACVWVDEAGDEEDTKETEDCSTNGKEWVEEQLEKAESSNDNALEGVRKAHSEGGGDEADAAWDYLEQLRGLLAKHHITVMGLTENNEEVDLLEEATSTLNKACEALDTAREWLVTTRDLISKIKPVLRGKGFDV